MSDWVNVKPVNEFPPGSCKVVDVDGAMVAVFNLDNTFYAIEDVCTHDGGELANDTMEEGVHCLPASRRPLFN